MREQFLNSSVDHFGQNTSVTGPKCQQNRHSPSFLPGCVPKKTGTERIRLGIVPRGTALRDIPIASGHFVIDRGTLPGLGRIGLQLLCLYLSSPAEFAVVIQLPAKLVRIERHSTGLIALAVLLRSTSMNRLNSEPVHYGTPAAWLLVILLTSAADLALADEWPQWMGPNRDNRWTEQNILESFPPAGPEVLWRTPVAGGYAGPAVAQGKVFIADFVTGSDVKIANFEREASKGTERVICLDSKSGEQIWTYEYPVEYAISYPAGPRCTPVVEKDRVYTLGAEGQLACLNIDAGNVIWECNLKKNL